MPIETIDSGDEFLSLRGDWNELLSSSTSDCIFLTHEWLSTWWKHLAGNRRLSIVAVRSSSGQLQGLLPVSVRAPQFSRMTPRAIEFLGSGVIGSDYLDVIVRQGAEPEVLPLMAQHLDRMGLMLQFTQLRGGESATARLARHLEADHWAIASNNLNICPFIDLSGHTWESYLAGLSSNHRYNFQRRLKSLSRNDGFVLHTASNVDEVDQSLNTLIELHRKRWSGRADLSEAFQTPEIVAFHREFAHLALARNWLRLLTLHVEGKPAASLYGLHYGRTFSFYQSGFEPAYSKQSVGLVMMGLAIKSAIDAGASEYDLLHGNEEYKFHWACQTRNLCRLECFPPHALGVIYRRAIEANRAARHMARRVLAITS